MIISRTPFRVSFFGGGTDFPGHYGKHGGAVIATAIDKYAYLSVHRLSPFFKHRYRASYARTESVISPHEFQHPLIRECLLHLNIHDGMEIMHVSDLPGRTGLGTSSSFTVGLLHALHEFRGDHVNAETLAREAIIIERERVGDLGGHQDQYIAAYGGFIRINFSGDQHVEVQRLVTTPPRMAALEDHLMMFYLGTEMSAETILREQQQRIADNSAPLADMRRMVDDAQAIIEGHDDLSAWGALLHESWCRKKELAPGISNSKVDAIYERAAGAGAVGGKLLGAGGRGFLLFYVEPNRQDAVRTILSELMEVSFAFSPEGSRIIFRTPE